MKTIGTAFLFILITASIAALAFGGWWLERAMNYSMDYKDRVRHEVRSMVKSECLR